MKMKISKFFLPVAVIAITAAAFQSCNKSKSDDSSNSDESIVFETRTDSVGFLVPDFYGDSVYCATKYSVVWPEKIGKQDFDAFKDSLTMLTFGVSGIDFDRAAEKFMRCGLNDLIADGDSIKLRYESVPFREAEEQPRVNLNSVESEVTLLTPELLVIRVNSSVYFYGAAHGMISRQFLNYSITNHQLMTPENTFLPGKEKSILSLISAAAAEQYPDEGVLFDAPIESFSNFEITENDFVFVYQPYEIGPFSSGVIEISVSAQDLYRFLTPEAIKALGL